MAAATGDATVAMAAGSRPPHRSFLDGGWSGRSGQDGPSQGYWPGTWHRGSWAGWGRGRIEFSVDRRLWRDRYAELDYESQPQGYRLWKNKARAYLIAKYPQIGKVLGWAER